MNIVTMNMLGNRSVRRMARQNITELRDVAMLASGIPRMLPADELLRFGVEPILQLMVEEGLYVWPTTELADWLRSEYNLDNAMEIGAGNGVLAQHLGVRAVDNYSQAPDFTPEAKYRGLWEQGQQAMIAAGQAFVTYGGNVERKDAVEAVIKYRPSVVYGLFITHKFRSGDATGNVFGVDEGKVLRRADYIMVGNEKTHTGKPLLPFAERAEFHPWLITRGFDQSLNRIWTWKKTK